MSQEQLDIHRLCIHLCAQSQRGCKIFVLINAYTHTYIYTVRACEWVDIEYGILHHNCRAIYPEINTTNILIVTFITLLMTIAMSSVCYDTIFHYLLLPASNDYGKSKGTFIGAYYVYIA